MGAINICPLPLRRLVLLPVCTTLRVSATSSPSHPLYLLHFLSLLITRSNMYRRPRNDVPLILRVLFVPDRQVREIGHRTVLWQNSIFTPSPDEIARGHSQTNYGRSPIDAKVHRRFIRIGLNFTIDARPM